MKPTPVKLKEGKVTEAKDDEIWIRANENVHKIAKHIIEEIERFPDDNYVNLACIGPDCVNQGLKAVAVARERATRQGVDLIVRPYFSTITDDKDRERTRLILRVEKVQLT